jgi:hypothetical protein
MPWLLALMFQVPMSSPQRMTMLGFLSAAWAGATMLKSAAPAASPTTHRFVATSSDKP